jgi:hypothetical protein
MGEEIECFTAQSSHNVVVKIKILNYDTVVFLLVGFGNRGGIV